ncbi:hypothetical protein [Streptomyces sp. NBC_01763]|uniref:hypothetical protein n=1 Tax=Streptomyces sp. NBC_01763 TaxID=2975934 RepID=UPI002DDB668D|nr:hypothetical protein [Streptomyces sp. NBC_01763]WSC35472.1 hypothetical protein OHA08_08130 [Streptomyces sp. NBC_01763]
MGTVADPEGVTPVDYVPIKPDAGPLAEAESALQEVLVHTRHEQQLAVSHWLLAAAQDMKEARKEWAVAGIALLRCGGIFSAIRIPAEVVHAAVGTEELHQVNAYLSAALMGGPVFVDVASRRYYVLVPASAAHQDVWKSRLVPEAECLGPGCFLGVPSPSATAPSDARSYWCVPMDSPGELCVPQAVTQLVMTGRYQRAAAEREAGE